VRPERLAEQIRMDVAEILQSELKDPRLPLVTCTRVTVTGDLRSSKLYVSVLGDEAIRKGAMAILEGATGYVRHLLAKRLGLRTAPEIRFLFDPSVEYGIRLEELLQSEKERGNASNAGDAEEEPESR
jgi:ribosome-binding factor A